MIDSGNINVQALGAFSQGVTNTASNVANVSTDGYQPIDTVFESGPAYINAISERSSSFGQDQTVGSNVDLPREMVNLNTYELAYKANAAVIRTMDQNAGTVLDLIA